MRVITSQPTRGARPPFRMDDSGSAPSLLTVSGSSPSPAYANQTSTQEQGGCRFRHLHHEVVNDCRGEVCLGRLDESSRWRGTGRKASDLHALVGRDDADKPAEGLAWRRALEEEGAASGIGITVAPSDTIRKNDVEPRE